MLKLTHSFCRYTRVTCENISYSTFVEQLTHLSCRGKTCTWDGSQILKVIVPTSLQLRLMSTIKKKIKRLPINANAIKACPKMSNSTNPSVTNLCYGDAIDITSDDDTSSKRHSDSDENKEPICDIPTDFRIWEPVGKRSACCEGFRFRVVSYNVLAQYLLECHPYLYTECGLQNLKWKIRAARIYDEILSLSPDIFCLQEVQVSHLNTFYKKFEELGYCGVFKQKTGQRQDGCAIYFKESLFEIKEHITVEYYQPEMPILNRDNIGLIVKLAPKCSPDTPIVVATTHLLYNPNRTDVRLAQLQVLLAEIDRFAYIHDGKESRYLPIILAGDLNSTPDSAVVDLLDRGAVSPLKGIEGQIIYKCDGDNYIRKLKTKAMRVQNAPRSKKKPTTNLASATPFRDNSDWKKIGVTDKCQHLSVYLNRKRGVATDFSMIKIHNSDYTRSPADTPTDSQQHKELFNGGVLAHSLNLKSVYHRVKLNGHLEATTFQNYWVTVDYIYFSGRKSLKLVERLRLPTVTECKVLGKLPNHRFGSDHLALGATFELKHAKSSL